MYHKRKLLFDLYKILKMKFCGWTAKKTKTTNVNTYFKLQIWHYHSKQLTLQNLIKNKIEWQNISKGRVGNASSNLRRIEFPQNSKVSAFSEVEKVLATWVFFHNWKKFIPMLTFFHWWKKVLGKKLCSNSWNMEMINFFIEIG